MMMKKKVVGSWFVLLQVCTIECAVQGCYVRIFENCDQTDHPVCAQRSKLLATGWKSALRNEDDIEGTCLNAAYSSRARLFLNPNRRDCPSNTSCGLGFRGLQKNEIREFEVKF